MAEFEPVGLGAFVTGVNEGWKNMNARLKEADDLRLASLAWDAKEEAAKAQKQKGEPVGTTIGSPMSAAGPGDDPSSPGSATGGGTSGGGGGRLDANATETAGTIREILTKRGWTPEAIDGALANGMAESGLKPWGNIGPGGENGLWQFHPGSHLKPYTNEATRQGVSPSDVAAQTNYMAAWVEKNVPGYSAIKDARVATDTFMIKFEAPKSPIPGSRFGYLPQVAQVSAGAAAPPTDEGGATDGTTGGVPQIPSSAIGAVGAGTATALPAAPVETPTPAAPAETAAAPAPPAGAPTSTAAIGPGGRATFPPGSVKYNSRGEPYTADLGRRADQKNELTHPNWPTTSGQQPYYPPGVTPPGAALAPPPPTGAPAALNPQTNNAPTPQQSPIAALAMAAQAHGLDLTLSPRGGSGLYNNTSMG